MPKKRHNPLMEPLPKNTPPYWVGSRRPKIEASQLRLMQALEAAVREQIRLAKENKDEPAN